MKVVLNDLVNHTFDLKNCSDDDICAIYYSLKHNLIVLNAQLVCFHNPGDIEKLTYQRDRVCSLLELFSSIFDFDGD